MLCAPRLVFGGIEGVGSHFHVLCSQTHFQRNRGRPVSFSCFVLLDSFSTVPRAYDPVFIFCAPGHVFGGAECVGSRFHVLRTGLIIGGRKGDESRFHVLRSGNSFRRYRGRRVPFSCFALSDTFLAEQIASGPIFLFCVPVLIFSGIEGAGSHFYVLRSRIRLSRYRGRQVPFSCFVLPDPISAVIRASGPFSCFAAQTHFRCYRKRRVPFSCFALPNSFSAFPRASGPVIKFCVPGLIFGGIEGVWSCFLIFTLPDIFSAVPRASSPVFMFCPPGHIFDGTEGVGTRFHVLCVLTRF
jgi:hypothetical protein